MTAEEVREERRGGRVMATSDASPFATEFKESDKPGALWTIEVFRTAPMRPGPRGVKRWLTILTGHIRRRRAGGFAYFSSGVNTKIQSLWDEDLERLKDKIRATPWKVRLSLEASRRNGRPESASIRRPLRRRRR